MAKRFVSFVAATAAVVLAGCGEPETDSLPPPDTSTPPPVAAVSTSGHPASIVAERGGFIPEGVEYDQGSGRFLTGSLAEGSIFTIGDDGTVTAVVADPELKSSVGIEVDEPRDRLLVANSDSAVFGGGDGVTGQSKLGVYALTSGDRLAMVDLAAALEDQTGPLFANDVAVDGEGNAYVTDTMKNVVFKVDTAYQPTVLHRFPADTGLNGIVAHPDGYLLVAGGSKLFKVPLADPAATAEVAVDEPVPGSDGVVWAADGRLVITSNSAEAPRLVALTSDDGWASARTAGVATLTGQATTAAAVGTDVYAVHPHFNDADPPSLELGVFE